MHIDDTDDKRLSRARAAGRRQSASTLLRSAILVGAILGVLGLTWQLGLVRLPGSKIEITQIPKNVATQPTAVQTKVEGVDKSNLPFKITASKATQSTTNSKTVDLEDVTGEFARSGAEKLDVSSAKAAYDSKARTLELEGQVVIKNNDGMTATMDKAAVDVDTRQLRSKSPVKVIMENGEVTADTLEVDNNGEKIKFKGRVKASFGGDQK